MTPPLYQKFSGLFILFIFLCTGFLIFIIPHSLLAQKADNRKLNTISSKKPNKNNSKISDYSGDRRVSRQKSNDQRMKNYTGDVKPSVAGSGRRAPRHNSYVAIPPAQTQKTAEKLKNYIGDSKVRQSRAEGPRNSGGYVVVDDSKQRATSKKISKYQGDVIPNESRSEGPRGEGTSVVATEIDRKQAKRVANYQGDLPNNYLEKRAKYRRKKDKKNANYKGDILVRTLNARDRRSRIKSKKIAKYQGDIIVKQVKKGMHPSAVYKGGKVKNSYAAKERYRKRMLKKNGRKSGLEDANYQKKKAKDPKYDKKESEIWY